MFTKKIFNFCKIIFSHKNKFKYILSRILIKLKLGKFYKIKRDRYFVRFSENNVASEMFIQGQKFYQDEEQFIVSLLKENSVFIDIGANIGNLSLAASNIIKDGEIYAIEAQPKTYQALIQNIKDNSRNIKAFNLAVSNKPGKVYMTDLHADDCNFVSQEGSENNISVQSDTIDSLLEKHNGLIDLIKIDVEGYELMALEGAQSTLTKTKYVYFELWDELTARFGYDGSKVVDFFSMNGFEIFNLENFKISSKLQKREFPEISEYLAVNKLFK